jgi:hypothetical protein
MNLEYLIVMTRTVALQILCAIFLLLPYELLSIPIKDCSQKKKKKKKKKKNESLAPVSRKGQVDVGSIPNEGSLQSN